MAVRIPENLNSGAYLGGHVGYRATTDSGSPVTQQSTAVIRYPNSANTISVSGGVSSALPVGANPQVVFVLGRAYYRKPTPSPITLNTFFYNPGSNTLTFSDPGLTASSATVYLSPQPKVADTLTRNLRTFFGLYPAQVEITLTRTWQDQPSAAFQFKVPYSLKNSVEENLRPGTDFQFLDVALQITSLSIVEAPASQSSIRECLVSLSCSGKWSGVRLREQNYLDPALYDLSIPNQSTSTNNFFLSNGPVIPATTTLQEIALRAGTRLLFPETRVAIPNDGRAEVFDWASEIPNVANNSARFPYWSSSSGVELIPFENVTTHIIRESDLRSGIQTELPPAARDLQAANATNYNWLTINNSAATDTITPLPNPTTFIEEPLYRKNFEWEGNKVQIPTSTLFRAEPDVVRWVIEDEQTSDQRTDTPNRWVRRHRTRKYVESGSIGVPPWGLSIKETSVNFDVTGYTQSRTQTWSIDGSPEREITSIYGFAVTAEQIDSSGGSTSVSAYWTEVERKTTVYRRDPNTGYFLGSDTQGFRLQRFKTEDPEDPETLSLENDDPQYALFQFKRVPYIESNSLLLGQLKDYYPMDHFEEYSIVEDSQGNPRIEQDLSYLEPFFVQRERNISFSIDITDNPEDENLPPLVTGKEYIRERTIEPILGDSVTPYFNNNSLSALTGQEISNLGENEFYLEHTNEFGSEGAGFDSVAQQNSTTLNTGRPSIAEHLPPRYQQAGQATRDEGAAIIENTFRLFSEGYDDTSRGDASFPSAVTQIELENAARSVLYTNNLNGGKKESFDLIYSPQLKEGDKLLLYVNGIVRQRRILSLTHNIQIDGSANARRSITSVEVARDPGYFDTVFDINFVTEPKPAFSSRIFKPYYAGRKLGGLRPTSFGNRLFLP